MSNILQIAYTTEGSTDERFLAKIIERTFEALLFESKTVIEIHPPIHVSNNNKSFNKKIQAIATTNNYFDIICVHCDSDFTSNKKVIENKIKPAFELVKNTKNTCKNLVAIIPVQMTEAWMLADIELFLKEINTDKSCSELGLPCKTTLIEKIANPKKVIEEALVKSQLNKSRRRNKLKISDLYIPLSKKIKQQKLEMLPSFKLFKDEARKALINLNYLQ